MDRQSAKDALVEHHSAQIYKPEDCYDHVVNFDGRHLKSYIPYIGEDYFDTKPRVLIYAMAQNLARAPGLIKAWYDRPDGALFRQYHLAGKLHLGPYDDGHLKIIASLIMSTYPGTKYKSSDNIHEKIAITNFVKFSFYKEGKNGQTMDANPPLAVYDDMWRYYSKYEISLLQPDIVVGVGDHVYNALERNRDCELLLKIPFPGRLNLNSRYVPKGKKVIECGYDHMIDIARIQALVQGTPDKDKKIAKAIKTDWYYFREMEAYFNEVLNA